MGKWFLTDYLVTVDRILMIFSADPREISISIEWWKINPLLRLCARACKIHITHIADFCHFWPRLASVSARRNFFLWWETLETFRDQSAMLGEPLVPPINPCFGQKRDVGDKKNGQFFLAIFVKIVAPFLITWLKIKFCHLCPYAPVFLQYWARTKNWAHWKGYPLCSKTSIW